MNPHKIYELSDKEIGQLLTDNFLKLGFRVNAKPDELKKIVAEIYRYQGRMPIDVFNEAFSLIAAGEIEVKERITFSAWFVGQVIKSYRNKDGYNVKPKKVENEAPHGLPPATDEDYYNGLICAIEGRFSERHKMVYGEQKDPIDLRPNNYPILPMTWAWDDVYRHLRILNQVDEVGEEFEKQKKAVITWCYTKYPNIKRQDEMFNRSPVGKSMNSPRSRAEQLRNQFWGK